MKIWAEIWAEIRHNLHISLLSHLKQVNWKLFLRKDEILELPRRQNTSKLFSVVPTTRNSSTTHRSRMTTREKWTVTWFWSCAVAYLSVAVVRSRRILNSLVRATKPCKEWEGDALNFLAPSALASFMHAFASALPPKLSQAQKNNSASYEGWEIFLRASPVKKTLLWLMNLNSRGVID